MHWRISRFQELEHVAEPDRARLLRQFVPRGTYRTLILSAASRGLIAGIVVGTILARALGIPKELAAATILGTVVGSAIVFYQVYLIRIRGALLAYLEQEARKERLPMCLRCGYNLKGLSGNVCPECGTRIRGSGSGGRTGEA